MNCCCCETVNCTVQSLLGKDEKGIQAVSGQESLVDRIRNHPLDYHLYRQIKEAASYLGVSANFREVIDYFQTPAGETPAGFRVAYNLRADGLLEADLLRDIAYDKNGRRRPQQILFSADTANPYEVVAVKDLVANLTCNPAIIYNLFINNPAANVGGKFKTRDEVLLEIGNILGPGCDISVELNDPFRAGETEILEEAARFRDLLSKYRVVIKVPHTGAVSKDNVGQLLTGEKRLDVRYNQGRTADYFRGHNLALLLREHGYRVNFTLMYEPYQTALALQARPYFINSFVAQRQGNSLHMAGLLKAYETTGDASFIEMLKKFMLENDYLSAADADKDTFAAYARARDILKYRGYADGGEADGLDSIRHNLRVLRQCNLDDTRLIICNFQGENVYPCFDKLLTEPEFAEMADRIVITGSPDLLGNYTSSPLVTFFHRRF
ncbi:MAG: transaldolase family protein, partial [Planctomycetes bacterium]|nr:transaldolase family protein [Planctomycetota bacterium]